jgi:hypothetical protein
MASVAPKAFRCTVYDEPATLGKVDDVLYVFYDDGRIVTFEVPMAPWTNLANTSFPPVRN